MNTLQVCDVSVAIITKNLIKSGLGVAFPWGEGTAFDMIIYNQNGVFIPVQIKTTQKHKNKKWLYVETCKNSYNRRTRVQRISYNEKEVKFIIAVNIETENFWVLPLSFIGDKKSISLKTIPINFINNFSMLF